MILWIAGEVALNLLALALYPAIIVLASGARGARHLKTVTRRVIGRMWR